MKITKSLIEEEKEVSLIRNKEEVKLESRYSGELEITKGKVRVRLGVGEVVLTNIRNRVHEIRKRDERVWGVTVDRLIQKYIELVKVIAVGGVYEPVKWVDNIIYSKDEDCLKVGLREDRTVRVLGEDFLDWVYRVIGYIISDVPSEMFSQYRIEDYLEGMDDLERGKYLGYLERETLSGLFSLLRVEDLGLIEGFQVIDGGKRPIDRGTKINFKRYRDKEYLKGEKKVKEETSNREDKIDVLIRKASIVGVILALGVLIYYILYLSNYMGG